MTAWTAFEIFINTFESTLYLCFFKNKLNIAKKSLIADTICLVAYDAFLTSYLFYPIPFPDTIGCIIFFLYALYMSEEKWYICALWAILKEIIVIASVSIVIQSYLHIFSISYDTILEPGIYRVFFVLVFNFILFIVFFTLMRVKRDNTSLHWSALFFFLGINVLILIVIDLLFFIQVNNSFKSELPFFAADVALTLITILSMFLLYIMTTLSDREHQAEIALSQAQFSRDYHQALKSLYTDMLSKQHDFKQQLQTLELLIERGNSSVAKSYFDKYKASAINKDTTFVTGNFAVDALLTSKALSCKHDGITFEFTSYPLNDLPIHEVDFCAVVGNLLDNAIEGVNRIVDSDEPRWIRLSFSRIWNMFYIICENSMLPTTIKKHQGRFITSKTEKTYLHGYGIQNIITIVTSAQGLYSFDVKDRIFIASITFPYSESEG